MDIDVPISVAYKCYSDREAIPQWMPFISSVKVSDFLGFLLVLVVVLFCVDTLHFI